ncbi:hypothetical protein CSB95_6048 [Pseudomonas aeruginosa]|nr:hypothetical protein CSC29_6932 [Pseudomonas aeruginosa]ESZ80384.1 hypothetical protein V441_25960 [Pseudomonas aeruginosa DHS29]PRW19951.1 hypothetical protein CSB95_6048 [Pseudomonas aeruginosa]
MTAQSFFRKPLEIHPDISQSVRRYLWCYLSEQSPLGAHTHFLKSQYFWGQAIIFV